MKSFLTIVLLMSSILMMAQGERQSGNPGYKYRLRGDTIYTTDPVKVKNATTNASPTYVASYGADGLITKTLATSFGSAGTGLFKRLQFTVTTDLTCTFQSDSLIGQDVEIVGRTFNDSVNNGFTVNKTTGTLRLYPCALAGQIITVKYGTYTTTYVGSGYTPTLAFINYTTVSSGASYTSGTHTLNGGSDCSNNPHDYAMGDKVIPSGQDGYILYQYNTFSDNQIFGFNTSGTNEKEFDGTNHNYEAAVLVFSGGLYRYNNHTGASLEAGTISTNDWIKIERVGGVVSVKKASDVSGSPGTFGSAIFTFTNVSSLGSGTLYAQANFGCFAAFSNTQIYNGQ